MNVRWTPDMQCAVESCDRPVYRRAPGKGWCVTHFRRWTAHGDPLTILNGRGTPLIDRFMARVRVTPGGCWEWTGPVEPSGYGAFSTVHENGRRRAHCWSYEHHVGPIPEGMTIDHLCHHPAECPGGPTCPHRRCVNPAHLEAVTLVENVQRAARARTTCKRGHPLPPYVPYTVRQCQACQRITADARMATKAPRGSPGAG